MTLVEVLAVVVILGMLATVLVVSFRGQIGRAKREIARSQVATIVQAIETYAIETGGLPTTEQGLAALTEKPQGRATAFLTADKLIDPWGNRIAYMSPGPESEYVVISYGADGVEGGAPDSEDADVRSDKLGDGDVN